MYNGSRPNSAWTTWSANFVTCFHRIAWRRDARDQVRNTVSVNIQPSSIVPRSARRGGQTYSLVGVIFFAVHHGFCRACYSVVPAAVAFNRVPPTIEMDAYHRRFSTDAALLYHLTIARHFPCPCEVECVQKKPAPTVQPDDGTDKAISSVMVCLFCGQSAGVIYRSRLARCVQRA